MQPTLAAFLKRSAGTAASAGSATSTAVAVTTTRSVTTLSSPSKRKKGAKEEESMGTEVVVVAESETQKKIKLAVEDEEAGESLSLVSTEGTKTSLAGAKVDSQAAVVESTSSSASTAAVAVQQLTWADKEIERVSDPKWRSILEKEAQKSRSLFMFLHRLPENKILPPKANVFEAFKLCPFDQVRVVILGQDPYHGPNQAHGLAFSVRREVQVPPSLRNIFKEASNDLGAKNGKHGNLEAWGKQGVLLLNALLTVEPGTPMAHKGRGWEKFTDNCIAALSKEKKNIVFMLWGKPAQEKGKIVDRSKHFVITSSHPSPLGASQTAEPFLGSKCFSRCNDYLKKNGLGEINWDVI